MLINNFIYFIIQAIVAFISTNIDDIIVLLLLFSIKENKSKEMFVVTGQYIGFSFLVAISLIGYFADIFISKEIIGLLGIVPIIIGLAKLINLIINNNKISELDYGKYQNKKLKYINPIIISTSIIAIANGGDNIGVYIPLFANCNIEQLIITLLVFYILLGVWCFIGYKLVTLKTIATVITKYGDIIAPFILIGLGIEIIVNAKSYILIRNIFTYFFY